MIKDNTFSLEDLDDTFWNKVIFIEIQHSSGLGGPGCLWLITSEPKLYYIGFDEFPYSEQRLGDFHPFFERITDVNQEHNSHLKLMVDTETDTYYRVTETGHWVIMPYDEEN